MADTYAIVWEFLVEQRSTAEFEHHYGPDGTWAALFGEAPGYLGTLLLRDASAPGRYLTIDRWRSAEAYRAFRAAFAGPYAALDRQCEALTRGEREIGVFTESAP